MSNSHQVPAFKTHETNLIKSLLSRLMEENYNTGISDVINLELTQEEARVLYRLASTYLMVTEYKKSRPV